MIDAQKTKASGSPAGADITVAESMEREMQRTFVVAAGILLLIAIGFASYFGVKRALLEVRAAGLAALRDAEVRGMEIWMEQRIASAERWGNQPGVREVAARMIAQRDLTGARPASCDSADAQLMQAALQPGLHDRGFVTYELIDRSGTVLASGFPEYCGLRAQAATFFARMDDGFAGHSLFIRPLLERDRLINPPLARFGGPMVWVVVPVRAADGAVIAVLALGESAATRFTTLLTPPGLGRTDEVYAFDERATMLTESRHLDRISQASLLKEPRRTSTALNLELRDPGGDLLGGYRAVDESSAWRRTRLVLLALAAASKPGGADKQGVILEPYRNYLGAEVIGAWRWLDRYDMAVALEIESDEAFAPLRTLDRGFAIALGLAIATAIGALIMVVVAWRGGQGFRALRRIGRYTLIKSIGEGGMAQVYLGRHALLKRPIAIKVLKRQATDELIKRFEREAQLASQLAHPNTVEIYDYGHTRGGEFYYVMEYVDGITLSALVARDGPLPVGRVIYFVRQICSALHRAHQQGLIHRDIKPENIMACMRGGEYDVIKILDFGLAKSLAEDVTRDITRSVQHVLGTPVYMSPERFEDPRSADIRADIYAIGAVAYLLATGKRLFDGSAGEELQFQIMHSEPAKPSLIRGSAIPAELEAMILGCLAKNPGDRPQSVQSLLEALRSLALDYPWSHREAEEWWIDHAKGRDGEIPFTRAGARRV
jgi:eukaryotic-like serine/threonine-protein kinase